MNIQFIKSERTSPYSVNAIYSLDGVEFCVQWVAEVDSEDGDISDDDYELQTYVQSDDERVAELVSDAITDGQDGKDTELYLFVRDTFDNTDAYYKEYDIKLNSVSVYDGGGNGFEAKATVDGQDFNIYLQLPNCPDSKHAVLSGRSLSSIALNRVAELAEETFESNLDMYVQENITTGTYKEKEAAISGYDRIYLIADFSTGEIHALEKHAISSYYNTELYEAVKLDEIEEEHKEAILLEIYDFRDELGWKW